MDNGSRTIYTVSNDTIEVGVLVLRASGGY